MWGNGDACPCIQPGASWIMLLTVAIILPGGEDVPQSWSGFGAEKKNVCCFYGVQPSHADRSWSSWLRYFGSSAAVEKIWSFTSTLYVLVQEWCPFFTLTQTHTYFLLRWAICQSLNHRACCEWYLWVVAFYAVAAIGAVRLTVTSTILQAMARRREKHC